MPLHRGPFTYRRWLDCAVHSALKWPCKDAARVYHGLHHYTDTEADMANKLGAGDRFPTFELDLVGGDSLVMPDGIDTRYIVALFYRGHW